MASRRVERGAAGAALVGAAGLLGVVQLDVFDFTPQGPLRLLFQIGVVALGLLAAGEVLLPQPDLPPTMGQLGVRFRRRSSRRWTLDRRELEVVAAEGASSGRRDAEITWTYEVHNTTTGPVHELDLGMFAEVGVDGSELAPQAIEPRESRILLDQRGQTPRFRLLLPSGGLPPGDTVRVAWRCSWPGFCHLSGDVYVLHLRDLADGAPGAVSVFFPDDAPIDHAEVSVARRWLWFYLATEPLGTVVPTPAAGGRTIRFEWDKRRGDLLLLVHTKPEPV